MTDKHKPDFGIVEVSPPPKQGLFGWLRSRFFAGMFLALPVVVTFMLLQWLIGAIDRRVVPLLPPALQPQTYLDYAVPGLGLIVLIVFLTLLGVVATNVLGRYFVGLSDRILLRVPIVRSIYSVLKQVVDVFANNTNDQFREVVLVQYPRGGTWAIGFVSSTAKGEMRAKLGADEGFISVFVPTTPNPTSGFLLWVKEAEVVRLEMTVEEAAKVIFSAGLVVPDFPAKAPSVNPASAEAKQESQLS
jgi:uncharacterized membrane protein